MVVGLRISEVDVRVSLYSGRGVECTIVDPSFSLSESPPFSLTCVCAVSDISCASTLSDSLIKVKSLDKETLCLCLPASISSREGPTEVLGTVSDCFLSRVIPTRIDFWSEVLPQCILPLFIKRIFVLPVRACLRLGTCYVLVLTEP